jgi:hypothetical protein
LVTISGSEPRASQGSILEFRDALQQDPRSASARAGLAAALGGANPVYRGLIQAEFWMATRPRGQMMGIRILPFIVGPIAIAVRSGLAATVLYVVTFGVIVVGFEIEPVTGLTILTRARDRRLLGRSDRLAALSFGVFVVAAIVCLVGAARHNWPVGAGAGCVGWALIGGFVQLDSDAPAARGLRYSPLAAGLLGVATLLLGAVGADGAAFAVGLVFAISVVPAVCLAMAIQPSSRPPKAANRRTRRHQPT